MRKLLIGAVVAVVAAGLVGIAPSPIGPRPARAATLAADWKDEVRSLVRGRPVSVSIGVAGAWLFRRRGDALRIPASNEKLLLSMALLDRIDPDETIPTRVVTAARIVDGVVRGNLWLVGRGDPETDRHGTARLAAALADAGIRRVRGSVNGGTGPFARDDWAPGWKPYFPISVIPLPTALTFDGNVVHGRLVRDPERRAAVVLTHQLERRGVHVAGDARMGPPPDGLRRLASIRSAPLSTLLRHMDRNSINFDAEVLGKYLGQLVRGAPGTIEKGATVVRRYAARRNVSITTNDGSGLSYANRVTSDGVVRLLRGADREPWGSTLRSALPAAGQGTLKDRLNGIVVRAKTGTLEGISALSGWVWLERSDTWAEFSILSRGLSKTAAVRIENRVVRALSNGAEAP
jgi:D-alanyl-D-alanine carboxypeptidase/D-alanyl-D-alanine-endopeptidase (penicillin-binding protein 4)